MNSFIFSILFKTSYNFERREYNDEERGRCGWSH